MNDKVSLRIHTILQQRHAVNTSLDEGQGLVIRNTPSMVNKNSLALASRRQT